MLKVSQAGFIVALTTRNSPKVKQCAVRSVSKTADTTSKTFQNFVIISFMFITINKGIFSSSKTLDPGC